MPKTTLSTTFTRQVGTNPATAPLERPIVDELTRLAVLTVTLGFGHHRADLLRMAVVTALGDVNVPTGKLQWRVRLDRGNRGHVAANQEGRDGLEQSRDTTANVVSTVNLTGSRSQLSVPTHLGPNVQFLADLQHWGTLQPLTGCRGVIDVVLRQARSRMHRHIVSRRSTHPSHEGIGANMHHARHVEQTAQNPQPPQWNDRFECVSQ
jgi:hypothetical protein